MGEFDEEDEELSFDNKEDIEPFVIQTMLEMYEDALYLIARKIGCPHYPVVDLEGVPFHFETINDIKDIVPLDDMIDIVIKHAVRTGEVYTIDDDSLESFYEEINKKFDELFSARLEKKGFFSLSWNKETNDFCHTFTDDAKRFFMLPRKNFT